MRAIGMHDILHPPSSLLHRTPVPGAHHHRRNHPAHIHNPPPPSSNPLPPVVVSTSFLCTFLVQCVWIFFLFCCFCSPVTCPGMEWIRMHRPCRRARSALLDSGRTTSTLHPANGLPQSLQRFSSCKLKTEVQWCCWAAQAGVSTGRGVGREKPPPLAALKPYERGGHTRSARAWARHAALGGPAWNIDDHGKNQLKPNKEITSEHQGWPATRLGQLDLALRAQALPGFPGSFADPHLPFGLADISGTMPYTDQVRARHVYLILGNII